MNVLKFATAASALACAFSMPAYAASSINGGTVTLDSTDPFTWTVVTHASSGSFDGNEESTIHYDFLGTAGNTYNFSYLLENTSVGDAGGPSIAVFGFNVSPSPLSVLAGAADTFQEGSGGNFNGLSPNVEFCFFAGNNCNGGGSDGVFPGDSATGTFTINFNSLPASIDLSTFASRFQRTLDDNSGSASGAGTPTPGGSTPPGGIPEPATWMMMILGFGLIGTVMRRRRRMAVRYSFA